MSEYGGFLFFISEPGRAARFRGDIGAGRAFTDAVSDLDWNLEELEIFILSLTGETVDYAALARRGKAVASRKSHVAFSDFVEFQPQIEFHELDQDLPFSIRDYLSSTTGLRIAPQQWQRLIAIIKGLRPTSAMRLDALEQMRLDRLGPDHRPGIEVVAQEKDAINIALRISGFDHDRHLKWKPPEQGLAHFLQGLEGVDIREDAMIQHDAQVFGDWEFLERHQVGAAVFHKDNERLTIMNVNRARVENELGVDLLYYHHRYQAYVMVQYKRMLEEGRDWVYRPTDDSFAREFERMQEVERRLAACERGHENVSDGYRLNPGFFFFKLCRAVILDPVSTDMISGTYVPLDFLEAMLQTPDIRGPRGGIGLTERNMGRNLSNTLFIDLVQNGWVGSRGVDTAEITEMVRAAIRGRRSVILAARQPANPHLF